MKFCPRCGSKNIDSPLPYDLQKYECKNCGYVGAFIIDDGVIADEIRKDYLKKEDKVEE